MSVAVAVVAAAVLGGAAWAATVAELTGGATTGFSADGPDRPRS